MAATLSKASRQPANEAYSARTALPRRAVACGLRSGEHRLDPACLAAHSDRLYRLAFSLCSSAEESEDLVQETFARVLLRPRIIRAEDDTNYLLQALRHTFLSVRRGAARRPRTYPVNVAVEDIEDQGTLRPEAHLEFALLCQAVFELPIDFRDAVLAVDVVGLHYREAAHGLGVKEATLASRVFRARERLAETLAPR